MQNDIDYIKNKVDKIEDKLDDHLERLAKAESEIGWIKGHIKIVTTLAISLVGGLLTMFWDTIKTLIGVQ